jgi:hypothetical protein
MAAVVEDALVEVRRDTVGDPELDDPAAGAPAASWHARRNSRRSVIARPHRLDTGYGTAEHGTARLATHAHADVRTHIWCTDLSRHQGSL